MEFRKFLPLPMEHGTRALFSFPYYPAKIAVMISYIISAGNIKYGIATGDYKQVSAGATIGAVILGLTYLHNFRHGDDIYGNV